MDKRTAGIIGLIVSILLCGLPGLAGLCLGPLVILSSQIPDNEISPADARISLITGIVFVIFSLVLIAIPIVIGIFTSGKLKQKPVIVEGVIPEQDF